MHVLATYFHGAPSFTHQAIAYTIPLIIAVLTITLILALRLRRARG